MALLPCKDNTWLHAFQTGHFGEVALGKLHLNRPSSPSTGKYKILPPVEDTTQQCLKEMKDVDAALIRVHSGA